MKQLLRELKLLFSKHDAYVHFAHPDSVEIIPATPTLAKLLAMFHVYCALILYYQLEAF